MGQKWYFATPWGKDVAREAWNRGIQGTAATIIGRAMRALDVLGCPICLQHHDALYVESPSRDVEKWAQAMRSVMELPVAELGGRVFPVDLEVGPSWGELEAWL
jgi:DNA polymerase I-like protein with 3'-5' exonuclease and polymerase domains